jgi:hypothetical protein
MSPTHTLGSANTPKLMFTLSGESKSPQKYQSPDTKDKLKLENNFTTHMHASNFNSVNERFVVNELAMYSQNMMQKKKTMKDYTPEKQSDLTNILKENRSFDEKRDGKLPSAKKQIDFMKDF